MKQKLMFFLALSCFFDDPTDVGNLLSGSSALSKSSLNFWKFTVHVLLKPDLENFEQYFASMWDECSYVVVAFFGIAFLWDWNEKWPFPVSPLTPPYSPIWLEPGPQGSARALSLFVYFKNFYFFFNTKNILCWSIAD